MRAKKAHGEESCGHIFDLRQNQPTPGNSQEAAFYEKYHTLKTT